MHYLIFRNARIIDGTGAPAFAGSVAIDGDIITAVHRGNDGPADARRVIDAGGCLLTQGFVDIHTHYDGQVCWDKSLTPSCWHGVTTVVMGNYGVGFAPIRPGHEGELVALMESVEDIPGTALYEGVTWGWETFEQYLDAIDTPYVMDVGAQVPHVAVRHYVIGERSYDDATSQDMAEVKRITRAALEAGALGFSTSCFYGHVDKAGRVVPGTNASAEEMTTIGSAFEGLGHGAIELISDWLNGPEELKWIEPIARTPGRPVTPEIHERPLSERVAALRDPAFRARVLAEPPILPRNRDAVKMISDYPHIYPMDPALSYEPSPDDSLAAIAARKGVSPIEVIVDTMADGVPLLVLFGNYPGGLENQRRAIEHPQSVFGLSDGGAHCGVLAPGCRADCNVIDCDALALEPPQMVRDLPAGRKRLIQRACGYVATVCAGEVTFEHGEAIGAQPGRLLRGGALWHDARYT